MPNRRDFIFRAAATGGLLILNDAQAGSLPQGTPSTSLRVLILGGTGYIGPHFVNAAVSREHRVSVFNRGKSDADLPAEVERLRGDRNDNLEAIENRDWDAVLDLAVYEPIWVRTLGRALNKRIGHYTLISSVAVYRDDPSVRTETDNLKALRAGPDPFSATPSMTTEEYSNLSFEKKKEMFYQYGAYKVIAEQEAERQFPGKTLAIRPHAIIGPHDNTNHIYWPARLLRGGEVLVPGNPADPFQLIDVRDLAEFTIRMVEQRATGPYNVLGPAAPITWGQFIQSMRDAVTMPTQLTWVSSEWLLSKGVQQPELPLWFPFPDHPAPQLLEWANFRMSNKKALAKGLTLRSIGATTGDTISSCHIHSCTTPEGWGMAPDRERELLAMWRASAKQ